VPDDDTVREDPANLDDNAELDDRTELDAAAYRDPGPTRRVPSLLAPTDVVPALRSELKLMKRSGGAEVYDPNTRKTLTLNHLEISLARMLDGKRQVSDLIAAGERLGIPVNLESLTKFIQRLEEQGLLGAVAAGSASTTWASRGQWEQNIRTLFQSGIRLLRLGKHAEAANYFEALLQEDPDNEEARELLAMAKQGVETKVPARPPTPVPEPIRAPVAWPSSRAEARPASEPSAESARPESLPVEVTPSRPSRRAERAPIEPERKRRRRPIWIDALVACVVGLGLGFAMLWYAKRRETPVATARADARPADATKIVMAKEVDSGVPIDAMEADAQADVDAQAIDAAPADAIVDAAAPQPTTDVVRVEAPAAGSVKVLLTSPKKVRKGDKLFEITRVVTDAAKVKELTAKIAELKKLAAEDPMYEPFIAKAKKDLANAQKRVSTVVVAPRDGKATPRVKQGANVHAGDVLAEIQ